MQPGSAYPNAMAPGWSGMDDATLDAVIMDPSASAAQKAAAAAAKRSRSVMRTVQPTMERMGNDLSGVVDMAKEGYGRMMGGGDESAAARLPRGDVQDPLAGTAMRAPPPMSGEFPVERPDMAALAGSVPPALLAQSAARAQPPGPADDIQAGANAAKAIATPPAPAPAAAPGGPDEFGNMSPSFLEMAKKFVGAQEDAPLTAEDKWLALARAGFGMAASQAPSFGQALGEGAMSGITQLQQVRAQRAEQAARRSQMGLQVASTDAQLRQGDRNYQLAQQREQRERDEFNAGAAEREARVSNLKANAAESYAQAEAAKKGGGTQVTARLSEALAIQQAYANRNPPVQIDIAEALEKTRADRNDGLTESQALRLAADAAEIAQVEGKSIEDVLSNLKKNADSLRGKSAPTDGGAAAPAVAASTTPIVVKSQKDIDNAPSGAVLIVNGQQYKKP
jgi:hypothetical protein